ncbi:sulfurtransferase [Neptunitalea lumnitzerae]|uniref:Sulfurtransferase n=1 Tax=Neptunitalea lumnitzerae TaxID=2965509 RepID=A0ABQ5MFY8_9FLAO|nr:sulfurtransferase [Neptunitalea sp. Y10]GLB47945.1 sulfurtransferase [Neptunitalea sp. Y10]
MEKVLSPIVEASILQVMMSTDNLVLVDAGSGESAKEAYIQKHIKGALFVDLNSQLSDIKDDPANGGRHPLPSTEDFAKLLINLGITLESHIVIYDTNYGANAAARFWWMLTAAGHQKVQVLNGGFQAAEKEHLPMETGLQTATSQGAYTIDKWLLPTASMQEVATTVNTSNGLVIDVRDTPRYNGEVEPIDTVAGHIPGAVNIPFKENLSPDFKFKSPQALLEKYNTAFEGKDPDHIIIHCGSGVTACHTLLATAYAGLPIPKLYVGSWSEWSRNNNPMFTLD